MDILGHLILCISALATVVVVGTFILIMLNTVLDAIDEQQQARERDKKNRFK